MLYQEIVSVAMIVFAVLWIQQIVKNNKLKKELALNFNSCERPVFFEKSSSDVITIKQERILRPDLYQCMRLPKEAYIEGEWNRLFSDAAIALKNSDICESYRVRDRDGLGEFERIGFRLKVIKPK